MFRFTGLFIGVTAKKNGPLSGNTSEKMSQAVNSGGKREKSGPSEGRADAGSVRVRRKIHKDRHSS